MITRKEIRYIPILYKEIQKGNEHLEYLKEKATSTPCALAKQYTSIKAQQSYENKAARCIEAAIDYEKKLDKKKSELDKLKDKALRFINTIDSEKQPLAISVLKYRYINCYTWNEIADLLGYRVRYLQRIENDAIAVLA